MLFEGAHISVIRSGSRIRELPIRTEATLRPFSTETPR